MQPQPIAHVDHTSNANFDIETGRSASSRPLTLDLPETQQTTRRLLRIPGPSLGPPGRWGLRRGAHGRRRANSPARGSRCCPGRTSRPTTGAERCRASPTRPARSRLPSPAARVLRADISALASVFPPPPPLTWTDPQKASLQHPPQQSRRQPTSLQAIAITIPDCFSKRVARRERRATGPGDPPPGTGPSTAANRARIHAVAVAPTRMYNRKHASRDAWRRSSKHKNRRGPRPEVEQRV